jgi:uncharacterized membrane protein YfcA
MDFDIGMVPYWALLFGVGVLSSYLNVLAGGGSALTLPLLIFMGLDGALANGTNRVAILVQNVSSVAEFQRSRRYPVRKVLLYSLWTLPGAAAGAFFATEVSDALFQTILGLVIIGVVITLLLPRGAVVTGGERGDLPRSPWIYPALFGIGFYGGFIQVGVGFLFMAALFHLLRLDLVNVNMYKVFIVLVYTVPALLIFMWSGDVDWLLGWILAAGSALGGWLAVKAAIRGGEKIIRIALVVSLLLMGAKLLGIF